ncbi:MAG: DMT family transporter [Rhodospirillaceae bacterium]|nr:DMT family transporter [Rhodospirillaceae bacterium]
MTTTDASRSTGALLVAGAALFWSSGGLLFRQIQGAGDWTITFWRAVFMVAALLVALAAIERGRVLRPFLRAGWPGVASGLCFGVMMTGYMLALARTSVANTMLLMAAAPFFAALLAWAALSEKPRPAVWLAMAVAIAGIALMVAGDLGGGAMAGNIFALMIAGAAAVNIVIVRRARAVNMVPAIVLGGIFSALFALPLADQAGLDTRNLTLIFLLGVVQLGGGCVLYLIGARYLLAAETSLIALLESVLAPIWVWLFIGETPTRYGLIGGGMVLAAVVALTVAAGRRRPSSPAVQPAE